LTSLASRWQQQRQPALQPLIAEQLIAWRNELISTRRPNAGELMAQQLEGERGIALQRVLELFRSPLRCRPGGSADHDLQVGLRRLPVRAVVVALIASSIGQPRTAWRRARTPPPCRPPCGRPTDVLDRTRDAGWRDHRGDADPALVGGSMIRSQTGELARSSAPDRPFSGSVRRRRAGVSAPRRWPVRGQKPGT
jgi:hypothetical protein